MLMISSIDEAVGLAGGGCELTNVCDYTKRERMVKGYVSDHLDHPSQSIEY
jgi:hypothetical protein